MSTSTAGPVTTSRRIGAALARGLIFLIEIYRHMVSPLRPPSCRFVPTCSRYAVDALGEYGLVRGMWLATTRLAKCGPWHPGGWDPIPERPSDSRVQAVEGACDHAAKQGESELLV